MFRKISSAAAEAHSFSSPFTRPPKPTPLNSRNSTSLLQMFQKISSSAAKAHSFSSLASPPNGNFASLFTLPPQPTRLNPRKSRSRFTNPAETASSWAVDWLYELKIWTSTKRLKKFLQTNCKSGDVSSDEAIRFFHRMAQMEPRFRLYSFNLLLNGLAKNKRYYDVVSLYGKMNSAGLTPNMVTLNILLNCSCKTNRLRDAFMVMGRSMRKGYSPDNETFNSLSELLCFGNRVADGYPLSMRLEKCGFHPYGNGFSTLTIGLCSSGYTSNALRFDEEMVSGNVQYGVRCKSNTVSYSCITDGPCKEVKEDKVMVEKVSPDVWTPSIIYDLVFKGVKNGEREREREAPSDGEMAMEMVREIQTILMGTEMGS